MTKFSDKFPPELIPNCIVIQRDDCYITVSSTNVGPGHVIQIGSSAEFLISPTSPGPNFQLTEVFWSYFSGDYRCLDSLWVKKDNNIPNKVNISATGRFVCGICIRLFYIWQDSSTVLQFTRSQTSNSAGPSDNPSSITADGTHERPRDLNYVLWRPSAFLTFLVLQLGFLE
jgi:hypothetical protein